MVVKGSPDVIEKTPSLTVLERTDFCQVRESMNVLRSKLMNKFLPDASGDEGIVERMMSLAEFYVVVLCQ